MKYNKLPITIESQIIKFKSRGLKFRNDIDAAITLSNINYYRLRAYTYPFQNNLDINQPFNGEVTFEEIISRYIFDRKLRLLIFEALEKIEIALRTQIIYHFSLKFGSHWQLNPLLYRNPMLFANHLSSLQKEIDRSSETFIEHYKSKYTNPLQPPCWMSLEVSSMGLLSKIFQNLKKGSEKNAITTHFGLTDVSVIENWIFCFSALRNICAHHGRIWNRRLIPIKIPTRTNQTFLENKNIYPNKLYTTLACIQYILKVTSLDYTFGHSLKELTINCSLTHIKEMGFPETWLNEYLWESDL